MSKNFAVLDNNSIVTNAIVAETLEIAQEVTGQTCVEFQEEIPVYIGGKYDPIKDEFVAPAEPTASVVAPAAPTEPTAE